MVEGGTYNNDNLLKAAEMDNETKPTYSILLPTYNEKENLPIVIWLIEKFMNDR